MAAAKHEKNFPITFIPANVPGHILSGSNGAQKSIIGEISFFYAQAKVQELINW